MKVHQCKIIYHFFNEYTQPIHHFRQTITWECVDPPMIDNKVGFHYMATKVCMERLDEVISNAGLKHIKSIQLNVPCDPASDTNVYIFL